MNQKITMVIVAVSLIIGIGGFFYGLSQSLESEKTNVPVDAQTAASSDVLADDAAGDPVRYDELLQQVAPLSGTTIAVKLGRYGAEVD